MTPPASNSTPAAPSPIHITGDGLALGSTLNPATGALVGVLTITAAGGLVRTDVPIDAGNLDALVDGLRKLRADLPAAGGIVAATSADLGRLNGRH